MIKKFKSISAVCLTIAVLAGCGSNFNSNTLHDNTFAQRNNSLSQQFLSQLENGEIMIDEDYYRQFPDTVMANQMLTSISSGVVPQYPDELAKKNSVQANAFFSIFNKKALIDIYDSFATEDGFKVHGRVYKKQKYDPPAAGDGRFKNLIRNIKFFVPSAIKDTQVRVEAGGISINATTDSKGFFEAMFPPTRNMKAGVNKVTATLVGSKYKYEKPVQEIVYEDSASDKISIISDIDDTVKHTGVGNKLKMIKKVFLGNYKTEQPVLGMASLFKGLINDQQGSANGCCVHYVTGSPVHIYTRIDKFLELNQFPEGSLDTKKMVLFYKDKDPSDQLPYKLSRMRPIVQAYPNRKFVVFGDTTQADTEVYLNLKKEFPNNILGIYINNVTGENPNNPRFKDVMLTNSAIDAAQDLLKKGLISEQTLRRVIADVKY